MLIVTQIISVITYEIHNLQFLKQTPKGFLVMKIFLVCILITSWSVSLYFFLKPTSDKSLEPHQSRALNSPCVFGDFYDAHDIWHFSSAVALLTQCLIFFHLDLNAHYKGKNIGERRANDYHSVVGGDGGGGGAGAGGGIDDSSGLEGMLEENEVVVERLLVSGLGSELVMRGDDGVSRGDGGSSYEDFVTDDPERLTKEEY
eukprot:TRINITY_DN7217_c0_g1_i13.p2 TRINITY_DN7217_c0_g1~~TRINITY_DN7217_c0_g1_i13.p2  ORF type:complete len:202 (+),score=55.03 TRINITY_DN7217_c0_g1_i13:816-1421(+)